MYYALKRLSKIGAPLCFIVLAGCGVKGDPRPPLQPTELGRGKPTFDKATQSLIEENQAQSEDGEAAEKEKKRRSKKTKSKRTKRSY